MRTEELKEKYPVMFVAVQQSVIDDIKTQAKCNHVVIPNKVVSAIAHNAAFFAVSEHHKMYMMGKVRKKK